MPILYSAFEHVHAMSVGAKYEFNEVFQLHFRVSKNGVPTAGW